MDAVALQLVLEEQEEHVEMDASRKISRIVDVHFCGPE